MTRQRDPLEDVLDGFKNDPKAAPPHLAEPDTKSIMDGTMCWKDGNRHCGADCVAWNVDADPGTPDVCVLLLYKGQKAVAALMTAKRAPETSANPVRLDLNPPPPKVKP